MPPAKTPSRRKTTRRKPVPLPRTDVPKKTASPKVGFGLSPKTPGWASAHPDMFTPIGSLTPLTPSPFKNRRMTRRSSVYVSAARQTKALISTPTDSPKRQKTQARAQPKLKQPQTKDFKKPVVKRLASSRTQPGTITRSRRSSVYIESKVKGFKEIPEETAESLGAVVKKTTSIKPKPRSRSASPKKSPAKSSEKGKRARSRSKSPLKSQKKQASPPKVVEETKTNEKTEEVPQVKSTPRRVTKSASDSVQSAKKSVKKRKSLDEETKPNEKTEVPQVKSTPRRVTKSASDSVQSAKKSVKKRKSLDDVTPAAESKRIKSVKHATPQRTPTRSASQTSQFTKKQIGIRSAKSEFSISSKKRQTESPTLKKKGSIASPSQTPKALRSAKSELTISSRMQQTESPSLKKKGSIGSPSQTPKAPASLHKQVISKKVIIAKTPQTQSPHKQSPLVVKSATKKTPARATASKENVTPLKAARILGKVQTTPKSVNLVGTRSTKKVALVTSTPLEASQKKQKTTGAPPPVSEIHQSKRLNRLSHDESVFPALQENTSLGNGALEDGTVKNNGLQVSMTMDLDASLQAAEDNGYWWARCNIL